MTNSELEEIIGIHGDMVYRIALTHTLDRFSAEDVFQEVFLELFKNYPKIKSGEHLKYWLIRTTVNESISLARKRRRYEPAPADGEQFRESDGTLAADLKMAVEDLPEKYRAVIYLCCYEGYTAEETGKILGKSAGTVKSLLHRARNIIKNDSEVII